MIEINLLPVRAARRKETFRFQLSVFILILFLLFAFVAYLKWNLNQREARITAQIQATKEEIVKLNKQVGEVDRLKESKARLQQKLAVVDRLERGRLSAAHILDELSQKIPEKIWLESLQKTGESLKIVGIALDNETIANFMTVLERSEYFSGIELEVTEQITQTGLKLKKFSLSCSSTS